MNKSVLVILFFLLLGAQPVSASEINGTIQTGSQYSWGENIGWVNFAPQYAGTYYGPVITDTSVTGYVWSQTVGWINFSPTNSGQGVSNTPSGHLSGSAWVSGLGWLSMDTVTIDSNGKFTGVAGDASSTVGRVNFDCDNCRVVTDWRPVAIRQQVPSTSNSNTSSSGTTVPNPITSGTSSGSILNSHPLISTLTPSTAPLSTLHDTVLPSESTVVQQGQVGSVYVTLSDGQFVKVDFPASTFEDGTKVSITPQVLNQDDAPSPNLGTFLVHGVIFNIVAKDKNGVIVHNLKKTITISIDIPEDIKFATDLKAYYLDETEIKQPKWVLIPDAQLVNGKMIIQVNHLTRFAIFRDTKRSSIISTGDKKSQTVTYIYVIWSSIALILLSIVLRKKKQGNK